MKKIIIFILLLICIMQLVGCGKKDLNELAIASAVGIDKSEGGGFKLTAQIFNANAVGPNPKDVSPIIVISEEGRTLQEAFRKLLTELNNRLFFSHFQLLLFGEDIAKEGIEPYLNFFAINQESLHAFNVGIVQGDTAENALVLQSLLTFIPSLAIEGKIKTSLEMYGVSREVFLDDVIIDIRSKTKSLALSSIMIIGDVEKAKEMTKKSQPEAYIKPFNIAIFKRDKLVGYFSERESLGFNYIVGDIKSTAVVVTKKDGILASVEINKAKSKITFKLEDNKPKIKISVETIGSITEDLSGYTKYDTEYVNEIEEGCSYEIKTMMEEAIKKAKELNSDVFGLCSVIERKETKYFKSIEDKYDEIFKNLDVEIIVKTEIVRVKP